MRLLGVLTLTGVGCLTAADVAAQPTGVPPFQPPPAAWPSSAPPPSPAPTHPGAAGGWVAPPPPNVTGAEGDSSPSAAGIMAVLSTVVPVGIGFTMMALAERDEGEMVGAGLAVVSTGVVFGPSVGHYYAGEAGHGLATTGLRLVAVGNCLGFAYIGALAMFGGRDDALGTVMFGLAGISAAGGLGLVVYDLVDAPSAARRANREDPSSEEDQAVVPAITLGPAGGSLSWTF